MHNGREPEQRLIVLLTDFGHKDPFVGIMKGVIYKINPDARIVDLCHEVAPQNTLEAALLLKTSVKYFPKGSIFVTVVDPGVGSDRNIICVETDEYIFIAPDNGLLGPVCEKQNIRQVINVNNPQYFLPEISNTFHGRDIFAPVAAYLSLGEKCDNLGTKLEKFQKINFPCPQFKDGKILGEIIKVDHFGNLITNISLDLLREIFSDSELDITVQVGSRTISGISRSYQDQPKGAELAIIGSSGYLEISVREGSAAEALNISCGEQVAVWS